MKTVMNIEIDRLIIEGMELTPGQQRQLKAGLETSLGKLFTEQGIPPGIESFSSMARMSVDAIKFTNPELKPVQLGEQIAHSIYQGINKQL